MIGERMIGERMKEPAEPPESPHSPEFLIDEDDRYSRLRLIGWWDQPRIQQAKILVVGAGALGNEVLKNLALLGLGTIYLVDFDSIQCSNLSRSVFFRKEHTGQSKATVAATAARELNPDCRVIPIHGDVLTDIGLGLVREVDLVICCVDNREARLWINRMCWKVNTPWIDGGIQEINGVAKVFMPPEGSCYECVMTDNDYRLISLRYSCPLLKQEDIQLGRVPTAPTIASIVGGLQVQEALKLLHDLPAAVGSALVFNGAANQFYQTRYPRREDCLSHETYQTIVELQFGHQGSAAELLETAGGLLGIPPQQLRLQLDRDFLVVLISSNSELSKKIERPLSQVKSSEGICQTTGQPLRPQTISSLDFDSPLIHYSLAKLGIPAYDIVKVQRVDQDYGETHFLLLAADRRLFPGFDSPAGKG
jgi:molybdopterin/thiamine biosynthesis adenylyltransferase